jgi:sulfatase maturation enzyme AslB (radical SAM superfamily)
MSGKFFTPLRKSPELHSLKQSCYSCPMFDICNGCYKTVKDLKQHNLVEDHCKRMKGIAQDIIDINGVDRQTTPYVDESNNE